MDEVTPLNTTTIGLEEVTCRANKGYLSRAPLTKSIGKDIFDYTPFSELEMTDERAHTRPNFYEAKFWVSKMGSLMSEKKSLLQESKATHREMMIVSPLTFLTILDAR